MHNKSIILGGLLLFVTSLTYPGSQPFNSGNRAPVETAFEHQIRQIYASLNDSTLNPQAFQMAMTGHRLLINQGIVLKDSILTLIDYSLPSCSRRFYVINLYSRKVVYKTLVAHGRNSGELYANRFSNRAQSHQSALGFYLTGEHYQGGQGYSMFLNGVDTGFNENARKRAIVIHGAEYVSQHYIKQYGRLGRSFGCPALPSDLNSAIIDLIKDGSVLFSYFPDRYYLSHSRIIDSLPTQYMAILPDL